jgi:VanZ family protein
MPLSSRWSSHARYTLPLLLWMGFVFYMSGGIGSAENTSPFLHSILRRILPGLAEQLSTAMVDRIDFNIRKTAHVTEYAIMAILAFRAIHRGQVTFHHYHAFFPPLIAIGYAATDEWHQSFIPSRWGAASDVVFDSLGALIGTWLSLWNHLVKRKDKHPRR